MQDLELVGFRVERGFEDVGEGWWEEEGEECESGEGGGEGLGVLSAWFSLWAVGCVEGQGVI